MFKETILVVEDDAKTVRLEKRCLEAAGYTVLTAAHTDDAKKILGQGGIDLLVLDYGFPGGETGLAFFKTLRSSGFSLPVIMVTGLANEAIIIEALRAGVSDFITKSKAYLDYLPEAINRVMIRLHTQQALVKSEARFSSIIQAAMDAIITLDAFGNIILFNPSAQQMFSITELEVLGQPVTRFLAQWKTIILLPGMADKMPAASSVARVETFGYRVSAFSSTKVEEFPVEVSVSQMMPEGAFILIIRDVTERKQAEECLKEMALYDALTGLASRVQLLDRLTHVIFLAERHKHIVAVLFLDLDHFKTINDSLGHAVGDCLLKAVAERLTACVRKGDTIARYGGDEFIIVLTSITELDSIVRVVQKIMNHFLQPFQLSSVALSITASIGVAVYPTDGGNGNTLLKAADSAMYRIKDSGRNNYQFYTREMQLAALTKSALEKDLHLAIMREEFLLNYQPEMDLSTGQITGVETLLRWKRPSGEVVYPMEFIRVAEESGMIIQIGEWVLRTACAQNVAWQKAGISLVVSVNISARQFTQSFFAKMVEQILQETGLSPEFLMLEINEKIMMNNQEQTQITLISLKKLGIQIAMDDFGTGAVFGFMSRIPIDSLKIASSFIKQITTNQTNAAVTTASITLAHNMKMKVVAKGVENRGQEELLSLLLCDRGQGYFIASPLEAADLTAWIQERQAVTERVYDDRTRCPIELPFTKLIRGHSSLDFSGSSQA